MEKEEIIEVSRGLFTTRTDNTFGVIITDPVLLDPVINNEKLKEKEKYKLRTDPYCYEGTNFKGQLVLGLIFNSQEEMFEFLVELRRLGYLKSKINRIDSRVLFARKNYTTETLNSWQYTNLENIITVQIKEKELDQYKLDLLKLGEKLGYKFLWGLEDLIERKRGCYIDSEYTGIIK